MSFFPELRRRNVHRMAALYAAAAWLVMQVVDVLIDRGPLPEYGDRFRARVAAVGPNSDSILAVDLIRAVTGGNEDVAVEKARQIVEVQVGDTS